MEFIKVLGTYSENVCIIIIVLQATRDVDFLIALTAVYLAKSKNHVTTDTSHNCLTDIMVLLIHHKNISMIRLGKAVKGDKISRICEIG